MNDFIRKYRKTIELGRAIEAAVLAKVPVTKENIDKIRYDLAEHLPLDDSDGQKLRWWHQIGSRNPKPLMEELIHWMFQLGEWGQPPVPDANTGEKSGSQRAFEILGIPDYGACYKKCRELVQDLNRFFISIPRFASPGRPKGKTRPKVTPEVKEAVRKWLKARNKKSRGSVASLARKQKVSRATIYRVIEEMR
jgi:hypothetical protein